jgi:hypothetical protein
VQYNQIRVILDADRDWTGVVVGNDWMDVEDEVEGRVWLYNEGGGLDDS